MAKRSRSEPPPPELCEGSEQTESEGRLIHGDRWDLLSDLGTAALRGAG